MLKLQLHFHTNKDKLDTFINYSPYEAIDVAYYKWFDVISFTHHRTIEFDYDWVDYAKKKNILLIKWVEYEIFWKHILIYNPDDELYNVKTFDQLREYKFYWKNNIKIVAPHPFYPGKFCLGKYLLEHHDIFDGVEYSMYYTKKWWYKYNEKAKEFAIKYNKVIIGNWDVHNLIYIENTYSLIDLSIHLDLPYDIIVELFLEGLFNRKNKIIIETNPLSIYKLINYNLFFIKWRAKRYYNKFLDKIKNKKYARL